MSAVVQPCVFGPPASGVSDFFVAVRTLPDEEFLHLVYHPLFGDK
jgi:hypothetical protein